MTGSRLVATLLILCAVALTASLLRVTGLDGSRSADATSCGAGATVFIPKGSFSLARAAAFRQLNDAADRQDAQAYAQVVCTLEVLANLGIARSPINADAWMTRADALARANEIAGAPPLDEAVRHAFANARAFGRLEFPIISRRVEFLASFSGEDAAMGQLLDEEINVFLQYTSWGQAMNYLCMMTMTMGEAETARVRGAVERMRSDLLPTFDNVLSRMRAGTFPNVPRA